MSYEGGIKVLLFFLKKKFFVVVILTKRGINNQTVIVTCFKEGWKFVT